MKVGTAKVQCPECSVVIDVPIEAELAEDGDGQTMICTPDAADVWAHAWTHTAWQE